MSKVPLLHTFVSRPTFVVHWIAALENHAIDRARATKDFSATLVYLATTHVRLWIGFIHPVVELAADRESQGCGHLNVKVPPRVFTASFKHKYFIIWVLR